MFGFRQTPLITRLTRIVQVPSKRRKKKPVQLKAPEKDWEDVQQRCMRREIQRTSALRPHLDGSEDSDPDSPKDFKPDSPKDFKTRQSGRL